MHQRYFRCNAAVRHQFGKNPLSILDSCWRMDRVHRNTLWRKSERSVSLPVREPVLVRGRQSKPSGQIRDGRAGQFRDIDVAFRQDFLDPHDEGDVSGLQFVVQTHVPGDDPFDGVELGAGNGFEPMGLEMADTLDHDVLPAPGWTFLTSTTNRARHPVDAVTSSWWKETPNRLSCSRPSRMASSSSPTSCKGIGAQRRGARVRSPWQQNTPRGRGGCGMPSAPCKQFTGESGRLPQQGRPTSNHIGFPSGPRLSKRAAFRPASFASSSACSSSATSRTCRPSTDSMRVPSGIPARPKAPVPHRAREHRGLPVHRSLLRRENQRSAGAVIRSGQVNAAEPVLQFHSEGWVLAIPPDLDVAFLAGGGG